MKTPQAKDWSIYWRRPTVTSFGELFPENYDDAILDFWKTQLDGEFKHVVDVACGNGALTWIANDLLNSGRRQTRITGVDFASISPFRTLQRNKKNFPSVRFMGNTLAESLPFKDRSIDLVISQYGVEYTDLDRTVPELGRILTDAGRLCFVLHDKESVIVRGAMLNLEGFRLVLNEIAIHEPCLRLVELGDRLNDPVAQQESSEYQSLLAQINESANRIRGLVQNFPPPSQVHLYMDRLNYALNEARKHKKIDRRALIAEARDGLKAYVDRIDDLEAAALSEAERQHMVTLVEGEGFKIVENRPLYYGDDKNFGAILVAQR